MSRLSKMKKRINKDNNLPVKKSDTCLGKCDVKMFGFDENNDPLIYCNGCGRNMGR